MGPTAGQSPVSAAGLAVPPAGVKLAFDVGQRRIGVAACDRQASLAFPVATVDARDPWDELARLVLEYRPTALVVGRPITLAGADGIAAGRIAAWAGELAARSGLGVWLVDERMTTAEAARKLRQAGRSAKQQRLIVDQQAAVAILETVLAAERAGRGVGLWVEPDEDSSKEDA
ncbi:MAG: Holliday junction resolvase RuvX [Propionibacteriaceae bacterium]|jgi:putative Holliday junction resolvase|nr:Holliday junction resolvase RuvX [Propionibacteriaceae bacterium]